MNMFNHCVKKPAKKVLSTVASIMTFEQRQLIMNAFTSNFSYCLVVWMIHSRTLNDYIKKLQKRDPRNVFRDCKSTFCELLYKDNLLTIYHCNLWKLATEILKVKIGVAPVIMSNIFVMAHSSYNLRNERKISIQPNMTLKQYPISD